MKRHLVLPLASGLWILTFPSAHALIDENANGISDLWEKAFNANSLFSPANPDHAFAADPDGDGWTNLKEAAAGTNPFDANAPAASSARRSPTRPAPTNRARRRRPHQPRPPIPWHRAQRESSVRRRF